MANQEKRSVTTLRDSGLREKVAQALSESASRTGGKPPKAVRDTIRKLRGAASALESSADESFRSQAAKKGAQTGKRNAAKRSAAAKQAAEARAVKRTG